MTLKEQFDDIEAQIKALKKARLEVLRKSLEAPEGEKVWEDFFVTDFLYMKDHDREMSFPQTINDISFESPKRWGLRHKQPSLVKVRPCKEDGTYLGVYVGDFPISVSATIPESTGILNIEPGLFNPAIVVPALGRVVMGCESWWAAIKSREDLESITDSDIVSTPYMQVLLGLLPEGSMPQGGADEG